MKTRNIVLTLGVAALAETNVVAVGGVLSPRAADNQIRRTSGYNNDPNYTGTGPVAVTPRVADNQIKTVSGKTEKDGPSTTYVGKKNGTPKAIGECADRGDAAMSCCSAPEVKPMK